MKDSVNAFISCFEIDGAAEGPLTGLTFGAKDIYDVAGHLTGCGSPAWAESHEPAAAHAPPVAALLDAGARLVGKTHTDEIAYSLMGVNAHYGTPTNPADPRRVPGGSSSGSVAAVAGGLVDIGLGSDTGGSVRLPASFCGVYGIRTTHGAIALDRTMPLAPSFDTAGWFARDLELMDRVAAALGLAEATAPTRLLLPVDAWARANAATVAALGPALARLESTLGPAVPVILAPDGLDQWFECFRVSQAAEVWQAHGAWVEAVRPAFGPGVADRFAMAAGIAAPEWQEAQAFRRGVSTRLNDLLADGAVIAMPTSPAPAPLRDAGEPALNDFRLRALAMLCPAGLAGLPQLSLPAGRVDEGPVGLSLIGDAGHDRSLLATATAAGFGAIAPAA
ncbi:MAG: amidase [Pseudomonadota bacterium]